MKQVHIETVVSGCMPVGGVARQVVLLAALALGAQFLPQDVLAHGDERSGKNVVDAVCTACHGSGKDGAPKIGDKEAWGKLAARGLSSLTQSALTGIRKMPAHGGSSSVSDLEISRAITFMVNQSGGHWTEPVSKQFPHADRSGEQVVQAQCGKCHQTGEGGAPKIGDHAAWAPRMSRGLDTVMHSAIHGHGGMPARGGMPDLSDAELRKAIIYMFNPGAGAAK